MARRADIVAAASGATLVTRGLLPGAGASPTQTAGLEPVDTLVAVKFSPGR
jgi:hypothetical protein